MKIEISLQKLGITSNNFGSSTGSEFFASGEKIESYSPVDGALIGGASLNFKEFLAIYKSGVKYLDSFKR